MTLQERNKAIDYLTSEKIWGDLPELFAFLASVEGADWRAMPDHIRLNPALVSLYLRAADGNLQYVDDCFRENDMLVTIALIKDGGNIRYASPSLREHKQIALAALGSATGDTGVILNAIPQYLRDDPDIREAAAGRK